MADKVEKILDIKVNYDKAIKAIAEYQTKIDDARKVEKQWKEDLKKEDISPQEYNERMTASKVAIASYNDSIRIVTKSIHNQLKAEKEQEGSLISLRAKLSNLTAEYDALSEADRKAARGEELKKNINELTDTLKNGEEETQRYYRSVGNYKDSIIEAANTNVPFIAQINQMATSIGGIKDYFVNLGSAVKVVSNTTTGLTKVLKLLQIAIVSTGIGALIIALGSLISYFTKTQKGVEQASKIMSSLGAVINVIVERLSKLGSALVKLFTGDFLGAASDVKEAFSGIGDEIAREAKLAWELQEALNQIEKQEVMLSMKRAANRAEIEKLKKISGDTTKSAAERMKAAQKAHELEQSDLELQTKLAENRLANTLGYKEMNDEVRKLMEQIKQGDITADEVISKLGLSESTIEDLKVFRDQFNALQEISESSYTRQTEQQNKLNTIRKEAADKAKIMREKELAEVRKAEDELLKLVKDKRQQQSQQLEHEFDRQIEDLRNRLKTEKDLTVKARESINSQITSLEKQKEAELNKLSDEQLLNEIEKRQKLIATQLEAVKAGSEQEFQLKMQQLLNQRDAELSVKELTEEMKLAIQMKYNKQMDDLASQHGNDVIKKQEEAIRIRFETEIAQARGNDVEILNIKMAQKKAELEALQRMEGESQEAFNLRRVETENAYLDAKKSLADKEVEIEQVKFQAAADITNSLSALADAASEHSRGLAMASKVLALAEIAINTGKAIAAGVAQAQSVPFPGNIAAIATTIATVLSNITTAIKTVKSAKFATGGYVTGPGTGTSDSIPAQLSNGESVITARATGMFAPVLSAFNMMGGGVPINVTATNNQTIGEDMLARAVAKGMMMAPAPVVSVEEFTSVANRVKYIEESSKL